MFPQSRNGVGYSCNLLLNYAIMKETIAEEMDRRKGVEDFVFELFTLASIIVQFVVPIIILVYVIKIYNAVCGNQAERRDEWKEKEEKED